MVTSLFDLLLLLLTFEIQCGLKQGLSVTCLGHIRLWRAFLVFVALKPDSVYLCCRFYSSASSPKLIGLFFSGQGSLGNYKSIEAWPGLCNLCGIFFFSFWSAVPLCEICLGECPPTGEGFPTWTQSYFFRANSAAQECSICASGPGKLTEVYQLFVLSLHFSKNLSLWPPLSALPLGLTCAAANCRNTSSTIPHFYRSTSAIILPPLSSQLVASFLCSTG